MSILSDIATLAKSGMKFEEIKELISISSETVSAPAIEAPAATPGEPPKDEKPPEQGNDLESKYNDLQSKYDELLRQQDKLKTSLSEAQKENVTKNIETKTETDTEAFQNIMKAFM